MDIDSYAHVNSNIIHKSQRWKANLCPSMHELDKQNEVYPFSGLLFSLKREGNSDTYYKRIN